MRRAVIVALLLMGCSTIRTDNERYFYRSAIATLNAYTTSQTKTICGVKTFSNVKYPKFFQRDDLEGGLYFYNEIHYDRADIIPHETVHHISRWNNLNEACLEEALADVIRVMVISKGRL